MSHRLPSLPTFIRSSHLAPNETLIFNLRQEENLLPIRRGVALLATLAYGVLLCRDGWLQPALATQAWVPHALAFGLSLLFLAGMSRPYASSASQLFFLACGTLHPLLQAWSDSLQPAVAPHNHPLAGMVLLVMSARFPVLLWALLSHGLASVFAAFYFGLPYHDYSWLTGQLLLTACAGWVLDWQSRRGFKAWLRLHAARREAEEALSRLREREMELDHLASHDPLTNLANRRALAQYLDTLTPPPGRQVGILVIDLDLFKPVNDTYGHAAGDLVLMETARRLLQLSEAGELVARPGGDEFVVVALRDSPEALQTLSHAVRQALSAPIHLPGGELVRVSASIGLASSGSPDMARRGLLEAADNAMYLDKLQRDQLEAILAQGY